MTAEEYLEAERKAEFRSEFWLGRIYAWTGGNDRHADICSNLNCFLANRLAGRPCRVFGANMKVGLTKKRGFAYPDIAVACGDRLFHDGVRDVLINPTAIFEVLSDSPRAFNEIVKFEEYQRIPSLQHYVMINSRRKSVTHYRAIDSQGWLYHRYTAETDVLKLLDIELPLTEIYHQVELDPEPDIE